MKLGTGMGRAVVIREPKKDLGSAAVAVAVPRTSYCLGNAAVLAPRHVASPLSEQLRPKIAQRQDTFRALVVVGCRGKLDPSPTPPIGKSFGLRDVRA